MIHDLALSVCVKCGTQLERAPGPGRPSRFCSQVCKRLVEFELRRIDRRLAGHYEELREERADRTPALEAWVDKLGRTRTQRIGDLRRWIAEDEQRLRELVRGSSNVDRAAENA